MRSNRCRYLNIKYTYYDIIHLHNIIRICTVVFGPSGDGRDTTFPHIIIIIVIIIIIIIVVRARVEAPKELTTHVRVIIIGRVVYRPAVVLPCTIQLVRACVCNHRCTNRRKQLRWVRLGPVHARFIYRIFLTPSRLYLRRRHRSRFASRDAAAAAAVPSSGATIFSPSPPPPSAQVRRVC